MKTRWTRTRDLALPLGGGDSSEIWELHDEAGAVIAAFPMQVRLGKPFDVMRMKGQSSREFPEWAAQTARAVAELYAPGAPRRFVAACPCCGVAAPSGDPFCRIHGIAYVRCPSCAHLFVQEQPSIEALNRMFADNADYAEAYVSRDSLEQRLREIVEPKLEWVRAIYRRHYGRDASSLIDVGAGGGHFVACSRRVGLKAEGVEINKAAIAFAKAAFGVDLRGEDYLASTARSARYDLVTCWGLLEYTPEPARIVAAAREQLDQDGGMLIIEAPRADALSSAVQTQFPAAVWRHLAPSSHVNVFSDASIASVLHANRLRPVAVWYFGMDFYELLCQLASALDDDAMLGKLARLVAPMQAWLDAAEFVDDIVVAAVPA